MGRRTETASTIMTATQMRNAPAVAMVMTTCRSPAANDKETRMKQQQPVQQDGGDGQHGLQRPVDVALADDGHRRCGLATSAKSDCGRSGHG